MRTYLSKRFVSATMLGYLVASTFAVRAQEPPPQDILTQLREHPEALPLSVAARAANKVEEATAILMEAMKKHSCDRPSPDSAFHCGPLAWGLQALDPDSRIGENYLVRPVEAFLSERIPPPFASEAAEREMRFSPAYEAWWKERGLSLREGAEWETMYGGFLNLAAFIGDPKLNPLFRRGLSSNALYVVISSVRGLALLHDKTALPEILSAIERLKYTGDGTYYLLLSVLRDYDDPEVDRIIAKTPNEEIRKSVLAQLPLTSHSALRPKP
jgi:hypothetical protein